MPAPEGVLLLTHHFGSAERGSVKQPPAVRLMQRRRARVALQFWLPGVASGPRFSHTTARKIGLARFPLPDSPRCKMLWKTICAAAMC